MRLSPTVESVDKGVSLALDTHSLLQLREEMILALASEYCAANISWDEYVRTCEVIQRCLTAYGERLDEAAKTSAGLAALGVRRVV